MNQSMAASVDVTGGDLIALTAVLVLAFVVLPLLARLALRRYGD
jgi:hypothetical protein